MTFRKYIRLLLVLVLPLLAAGVIYGEYFSFFPTRIDKMYCDSMFCRANKYYPSGGVETSLSNYFEGRFKNSYEIKFKSGNKPSALYVVGENVTFAGEIVSIGNKIYPIPAKINTFNYFKQFEGKMAFIELGYGLENINSCQILYFTDDEKIIKLFCNNIELDVSLRRAEDFTYFKKLKENIFKEEEKVHKEILIGRLFGYSLPILLFLASSTVVFLILKSYRFVKAG
jgi:hypothetical protein